MRLYIRNKEKYDPSKAGKALVFVEFPDPRVFSVGQVKEVNYLRVVFHWNIQIGDLRGYLNLKKPQRSVSLCLKPRTILSFENCRPSKFAFHGTTRQIDSMTFADCTAHYRLHSDTK